MKYYESGAALAKDMGIDLKVLEDTHQAHYEAAKKTEKDPDGGSWPAYPSGKSWDEASGKTGSGKKFYHNIIPGDKVRLWESILKPANLRSSVLKTIQSQIPLQPLACTCLLVQLLPEKRGEDLILIPIEGTTAFCFLLRGLQCGREVCVGIT